MKKSNRYSYQAGKVKIYLTFRGDKQNKGNKKLTEIVKTKRMVVKRAISGLIEIPWLTTLLR
jgi:hypothetical protein